ncbi:hypothetical protein ACLHDG_01815 [Sulfurovum sp. CS9]|uniref:hypothetical protein n=1 Tax=Sulfurovum sp. CS9 TaxID=3391146 RepID=UPI0039E86D93
MKRKKIAFKEYNYVLHIYDATLEISVEDFEKLESGEIDMMTIESRYTHINYWNSESNDESFIDSIEYLGEVKNETV